MTSFDVRPDGMIKALAAAAFPDYKGRSFAIRILTGPINCASYWDGGSRSYFRFVRLADLQASAEVPAQSAFDRKVEGLDSVTVPDGFVCVEHSYFCGRDGGLTFHVPQANSAGLLPAPVELSWTEQVVLYACRSLKSSYAGIPNYRLHEASRATGITGAEYDQAKASLIGRKLLNKAGAITVDGRNACQGFSWPARRAAVKPQEQIAGAQLALPN